MRLQQEEVAMATVYVMHAEETGRVKIGITQSIKNRAMALACEAKSPLKVLFTSEPTAKALWIEQAALRSVRRKIKSREKVGEWFDCEPDIAVSAVLSAIKRSERVLVFREVKRNKIDVGTKVLSGMVGLIDEKRHKVPWGCSRAYAFCIFAVHGARLVKNGHLPVRHHVDGRRQHISLKFDQVSFDEIEAVRIARSATEDLSAFVARMIHVGYSNWVAQGSPRFDYLSWCEAKAS